eukprot:GHVS01087684.1.p2 GENE.GHVS01087684.1~~GHVS01087684.1.p2  ORF type:complete len:103 (+),score=17.46 GHVS01087684.1:361-669(+)
MVEHKHDTQHAKDVKGDRHSTKQQGQAYGGNPSKGGAGKYNWGGAAGNEQGGSIDSKDPMYDSGPDKAAVKPTKSGGSSPTNAGDASVDGVAVAKRTSAESV